MPADLWELLARQVTYGAGRPALLWKEERITYGELHERARSLAEQLRAAGSGPGRLIGVTGPRTPASLVALLAVLQTGAAYLPLPADAPGRVERWVEAAAPLAIVGEGLTVQLRETAGTYPEGLAYVIFTSGSTGSPKGVCVEHATVLRFLEAMQERLGFGAEDVLAAVTPITFDIHVLELWLPLTLGATIALAPATAALDGRELLSLVRSSAATWLQATPVTWHRLLEAGWSPGDTPLLRALCGGEQLSRRLAEDILARARELWNLYGPTEATVWCAAGRVRAGAGAVPLGPPLPHVLFRTEDDGELLIGGPCLARGYLDPEQTRERFMERPEGRFYRSGDRVAVRDDGLWDFLGRADGQTKIRGMRVEPGEVEAVLRSHPGVHDCAVLWDPEDEELSAYLVAEPLAPAELRRFLSQQLPAAMLPSSYHHRSSLPLSPHGKVDRAALPTPKASVRRIWTELLGAPANLEENFFERGGDSLLAAQAAAWLGALWQREVSSALLFDHPTPRALADWLRRPPPPPALRTLAPPSPELPLSCAQERLYYAARIRPDSTVHHVRRAWRVRGQLDVPRLRAAFLQLLERHEALRTTFTPTAQRVGAPDGTAFALAGGTLEEELARPFDLETGPLCRLTLWPGPEPVLALCFHHLVGDAWSLGPLLGDLERLYAGAALPPPGLQYADYACRQRARLAADPLASERAYWRTRLTGARPAFNGGPWGAPRRQLVDLTREELGTYPGATPFAVFLAALGAALAGATGQTDLTIGVPVAQRDSVELQELVGCVLNLLAVRLELAGLATFEDCVRHSALRLAEALRHQTLPFEQVIAELRPAEPLVNVLLSLHNPPAPLELEGLQCAPLSLGAAEHEVALALTVVPAPGGWTCAFEFANGRLAEADVRGLAQDWRALLQGSPLPRKRRASFIVAPAPPSATGGSASGRSASLEELVTQTYRRELGVETVGTHDRFFDLGGHSLLALRVLAALERELGRSLPLSLLIEGQTPAAVAAGLADAHRLSSCLVPLRVGSAAPPLYCVHANLGTVEIYRPLAAHLPAGQPVYAFEMPRAADGRPLHPSIPAMAARYVEELPPEESYQLCGVSLGGKIAYEMAQRLRAQGRKVQLLVLFDTWGPNYPRALPLKSVRAEEGFAYLRKRLTNLRHRMGERWVRALGVAGQLGAQAAREAGARPFLEAPSPLQPYEGRVHLFRAREQPFGCVPDPALGWRELAVGGLEVLEVPGYHERILAEPHVAEVARQLARLLASGQALAHVAGQVGGLGQEEQEPELPGSSSAQVR